MGEPERDAQSSEVRNGALGPEKEQRHRVCKAAGVGTIAMREAEETNTCYVVYG